MVTSQSSTGNDSWLKVSSLVKRTDPNSPRQIAVSRLLDILPHYRGMITQIVTPPGILNTIILPNPHTATAKDIAKLLAVSLIDAEYSLIQAHFIPPKPSTVILRSDGSFRHRVTRTYNPMVYAAIDRISKKILSNQQEILQSIYQVINGKIPEGLNRFKSDYLIDSEEHPMYIVEIPLFDLALDELKASIDGVPQYLRVASEYKHDRYMAHLSKERLFSRGNDIFRNVPQIDNLGRITLENGDPRLLYWMDLFSEFLQECLMRNISKDEFGPVVAANFPMQGGDDRPKVVGKLVQNASLPETPYLVKYGKAEHIKTMYEFGQLRIAPASDYQDPSLNSAKNDNELSISFEIDVTAVPVMGPGARKNNKRHIPLTMDLNSNYYVSCFAERLRQRLFMDFDYDACLIIKQPDIFRDKVIKALSDKLTGYQIRAERVSYYDPLCVSPVDLEPIFCKHHRYAYQEEVRIVAVPSKSTMKLEPIMLNLGNLKEITDLIVLPQ